MSGNVVSTMPPKVFRVPLSCLAVLGASVLAGSAMAQDTLTLDDALRLARENNGSIKAAYYDLDAAKARTKQSIGAFFPTVTPRLEWNNTRNVTDNSLGDSIFKDDGTTTGFNASWKIFDLGLRQYSLLGSRRSEDATRYDALQTLRNILYTVHQQFYDALRSEELLRVSEKQVERSQKILEQTEFGASDEIGAFPKKDILQAKADLLNAKVEYLKSKNLVATSEASLKSTIGWPNTKELPQLVKIDAPTDFPMPPPRDQVVEEGLRDRADLQAQRKRVDAQVFSVKRADREAGVSLDVDINYSRDFSPNHNENRNLALLVTYPLFDGGQLREAARAQKFSLEAARKDLLQAERQATAEIESAYAEFVQNAERVAAAKLALEAAQLNYEAATESQKEGINDLIAVLTAQVSLVTAESNYIEATFDYYVSDVNLRLVTGKPMPGEANR
ncbi:MAG: hypothetical protein BGO01_20320 [Armatimonadetes bacterium 55-13]|nr:TolC family protein [Armatimonadota bacterium]OJU64458.1 MAG: hypothetical protein BGO01_20320 [Armatimonadetes bacterium 55-13]